MMTRSPSSSSRKKPFVKAASLSNTGVPIRHPARSGRRACAYANVVDASPNNGMSKLINRAPSMAMVRQYTTLNGVGMVSWRSGVMPSAFSRLCARASIICCSGMVSNIYAVEKTNAPLSARAKRVLHCAKNKPHSVTTNSGKVYSGSIIKIEPTPNGVSVSGHNSCVPYTVIASIIAWVAKTR